MGVSDIFFAICTRGAAKSFLVALGALCCFDLWPYSEIVITSSTLGQAAKLVEKKMRDEIIKKLSPYLLYKYEHEYIIIVKSSSSGDGGYLVENKLNGSTIKVLPCLDSARGERSTWNIYEEARLLKKSLIDSVFEPMGHCRPAKYLLLKEYQTQRWLEKARSTYITSARFKFEWFWNLYKDVVTNYYTSKKEIYIPFAEDIFAAIQDGARTWADYRKNKKQMNEMDFRMEILNEMIGESADAFFKYQDFKENQVIERCFRPPTGVQMYLKDNLGNIPKEPNEIRVVAVDYAFANTTIDKQENDNTIIICVSGHWKGNRFERHLDYIEIYPAGDSIGAADRARELWWLYDGDYLIPDQRNGGEILYNKMTTPWEVAERGSMWDCHGLTVSDKIAYHVVPQSKLDDLKQRTVDPHAIKCIIPFVATGDLNSLCWIELKKQLEMDNIKFLVSMQDRQIALEDSGEYFKMTSEELVKDMLPYGQTDALIQEAVNLKTELRNDKIKLTEPRSGTKDRIVILSYANYILSLIEQEWLKQEQEEEFDINDIKLIW